MIVNGKVISLNEDTVIIQIDTGVIEYDLENENVVVSIAKQGNSKTDKQRRFFWGLVESISKRLKTGKTEVYNWLLYEAGISVEVRIKESDLPQLERDYRMVKVIDTYDGYVEAVAYLGIRNYGIKEMAHLIEVTYQWAVDIGCEKIGSLEEFENSLGGNR